MTESANGGDVSPVVQASVGPTRSLLACLSCRKAKVKCGATQPCKRCSGLNKECVYVSPRPTIIPVAPTQSAPATVDTSAIESSLNSLWSAFEQLQRSHGSMLASQALDIAKLRESVASGVADEPPRKRKRNGSEVAMPIPSPSMSDLAAQSPSMLGHRASISASSPGEHTAEALRRLVDVVAAEEEIDLVARGLVSQSHVDTLCQTYVQRCAPRISVLLPVSPSAFLRASPHLFSTVLTLALRATPGQSKLHNVCCAVTSQALRVAQPKTLAQREANLSAMLHLALWYADRQFARLAVSNAYEADLHKAWVYAAQSRANLDARGASEDADEDKAISDRFRLWLSVCSVDRFMAVFGDSPCLIPNTFIETTLDEARARLSLGRGCTYWDFSVVANLELFEIIIDAQDAFAPWRNRTLTINTQTLATLRQLNKRLTNWSERWDHRSEPSTIGMPGPIEDRNRLKIPFSFASMYVNKFALMGILEPVPPSTLDPTRVQYIQLGVEGALNLLGYALKSPTYASSLSFSIDYTLKGTLGPAGSFLISVLKFLPGAVDVEAAADTLRQTASLLQRCGPDSELYRTEFTAMQDRIDEVVLEATLLSHPSFDSVATQPTAVLSAPQPPPAMGSSTPGPSELDGNLEIGADGLSTAEGQWQSLFALLKQESSWDQFGMGSTASPS